MAIYLEARESLLGKDCQERKDSIRQGEGGFVQGTQWSSASEVTCEEESTGEALLYLFTLHVV